VTQKFARHQDKIGIAGADIWSACSGAVIIPTAPVGDRFAPNPARERHLVAGPKRDPRVRDIPPARAVDQIHA
jgi:hypothetical protein